MWPIRYSKKLVLEKHFKKRPCCARSDWQQYTKAITPILDWMWGGHLHTLLMGINKGINKVFQTNEWVNEIVINLGQLRFLPA